MTRVDVDEEDAADGVVALVVAVVELLVEALEREAVRRMESGRLTDEEVDRLGRRLAAIEAELERLKEDQAVEENVSDLRSQLDGLVSDAVRGLHEPRTPRGDDHRGAPPRTETGRGGRRGGGAEPTRPGGSEGG